MYCSELSYSLGYVSYMEFGFESQLELSFSRRLETASQGLFAVSWNFLFLVLSYENGYQVVKILNRL